jgi:hypothetical protein
MSTVVFAQLSTRHPNGGTRALQIHGNVNTPSTTAVLTAANPSESAMYRASYSLGRGTESYTVQLPTFTLHPPYLPEHPRSSRLVPTSLSLPGSWVSTTYLTHLASTVGRHISSVS